MAFSDNVRIAYRSERKEGVRLIVLWKESVPGKENIKYKGFELGACSACFGNGKELQSRTDWSRVSTEECCVGDKFRNADMPDHVTCHYITLDFTLSEMVRYWRNFNRESTYSDI